MRENELQLPPESVGAVAIVGRWLRDTANRCSSLVLRVLSSRSEQPSKKVKSNKRETNQ